MGNIVLQSAGSLSVAVLALFMLIVQSMFFFRKPRLIWYGWSAAISFFGMLYALGVFLEYNTIPGLLNRIAGLLEFSAIIGMIHSFYGFTLSYTGVKSGSYHVLAGSFHIIILFDLWFGSSIVDDRFIARHFISLEKPYFELALGAIGPLFMIYAAIACIGAMIIWVRYKGPGAQYKLFYLAGAGFWFLLGIHDGLAVLEAIPAMHYLMEYGVFGFTVAVLWVVFSSYVDVLANDKYRVITEFADDGILVIQDGKTVFENPACSSLIGRPVRNSSARDFLDDVVPEDRPELAGYYRKLINRVDLPEMLIIRTSGTNKKERTISIKGNIIEFRGAPAALFILRDVTERVRKEAELRASEEKLIRLKKMESLGLMAGGVAHDLNNVLSGIVSYPDLILFRLPEGSELRKPIETMKNAGQQAADIVQDMLTVARGVAISKKVLNMNDIINEYAKSPEFGKLVQYHPSVTIKIDTDPHLLNMRGSSIHIRKAIMNLISNATEAIRDSGHVVVSTMNCYVDRPLKGYDNINTGEYAVLTVRDNGPGISSDDLQRIFEPFFTKKVMGRSGTGLGLTVVWNVVQDHEGYIDVQSDEKGSQFTLYFQATRELSAKEKLSIPLENLYGHGQTILVVDDVKSQREILCSMLETLQYEVKAVAGGEEAVECLQKNSVDLLLIDMIMDPGIDGLETYRRVKNIHERQKAIIVSGFAETERVKETLNLGASRFVKKPLVLEELGLAVKETLDE